MTVTGLTEELEALTTEIDEVRPTLRSIANGRFDLISSSDTNDHHC